MVPKRALCGTTQEGGASLGGVEFKLQWGGKEIAFANTSVAVDDAGVLSGTRSPIRPASFRSFPSEARVGFRRFGGVRWWCSIGCRFSLRNAPGFGPRYVV